MRRAVISVTSNIAEGFGRKSEKEKVRFYYLSAGSLTELENQLIISKDLKYITDNDYMLLLDQVNNTIRLLKGLIRSFYP